MLDAPDVEHEAAVEGNTATKDRDLTRGFQDDAGDFRAVADAGFPELGPEFLLIQVRLAQVLLDEGRAGGLFNGHAVLTQRRTCPASACMVKRVSMASTPATRVGVQPRAARPMTEPVTMMVARSVLDMRASARCPSNLTMITNIQ